MLLYVTLQNDISGYIMSLLHRNVKTDPSVSRRNEYWQWTWPPWGRKRRVLSRDVKVSRPVSVSRPIFDGLGLGLERSGLVNFPGSV